MPSVLDQPDVHAPGAGDVGDHPARRGLAVGARHRDHRDLRRDRGRGRRRPGCRPPAWRLPASTASSTSAPGSSSSTSATARPISCGALAVPPRVGDDELVGVAGRPDPHGEPAGAATRAPPPGPAARRPGPRTAAGSPSRARPAARCGARCAPRTAWPSRSARRPVPLMSSGQLDRGPGEVEVRAFEDPQLDEGRHPGTLAEPLGAAGMAVSEGWLCRCGE